METELKHRLFGKTVFLFQALVSRNRGVLATLLIVGLLISAGCSTKKPAQGDSDRLTRAVLGVVAEFYGDYLNSHKGKAPKDNQAFYKYLESRADDLKLYHVDDPSELYNSHRDGRSLVIVVGNVIAPPDSPDSPWAAFEQEGVDGKILAVRVRGGVHEMTDEESHELFDPK